MSDHATPDFRATSVSPHGDRALFTDRSLFTDREAVSERVAAALLKIGAVTLRPNDPYVWTSGLRSPVYTDNRVTLSHPAVRTLIADSLARLLREDHPEAECIAGAATGGIAHAAWAAERLGLPMVYVRSGAKGHGKQNSVEGRVLPGQRVAVIEDTVSTGGSVLSVVQSLRDVGAEVRVAAAIFSYGFNDSRERLAAAGVPLLCLTDFSAVVRIAAQSADFRADEIALLRKFAADPHSLA